MRIIDTFCLVNILASGRGEDILTHSRAFYINSTIPDKLFLNSYDEKEKTWTKREKVDLIHFINSDKVLFWELRSKEDFEYYVFFAEWLGDSEAEALALGKTLKLTVATDDRKTMQIAHEHGIRSISTLLIILDWARRNHIEKPVLDEMLVSMQQRANFVVSSKTPGYAAWTKYGK